MTEGLLIRILYEKDEEGYKSEDKGGEVSVRSSLWIYLECKGPLNKLGVSLKKIMLN